MDGITNFCPGNLPGASGQIFLNLVNTLMAAQCALSPDKQYPPNYAPKLKDGDTFDYIVVGAGSAGSVVATRLSENGYLKVLLLEAGGRPSVTTEIPEIFFTLQNTKEDWSYRTEPSETAFLGLRDQRSNWPRGKTLGGTSAINGMLYLRGNRKDYDRWAEMGNQGWDYDSVQKYFQKSENILSKKHENSSIKHGRGGLLSTSLIDPGHRLKDVIVEGAKELGYNYYDDEVPLGYFTSLTTIENGVRCSSSKAFLSKIGRRDNLLIATGAQVGKILVNPEKMVAKGVEVKIGDKIIKVIATREVILSAGAINSPQILMNSGIGPKEHLESLGIPLIKDLKVGENLQDHFMFSGQVVGFDESLVNKMSPEDAAYEYFIHRRGSLAKLKISNLLGFINTKNNSPYPDIEFHHFLYNKGDDVGVKLVANRLGFKEEVIKSELAYIKETSFVMFVTTLAHPKSRGRILLRSKDPYDKPLIYANYLSDENNEDFETVMRGIQFINNLIETPAFKKYNGTVLRLDIQNCRNISMDDAYFACAIRNLGTTMYHPVGTCKMGPENDPTAIVDSKLRVHGVKNLRVVDASIMPFITSVNTNAPTIMIGERAVDFIKDNWANRRTNFTDVDQLGSKKKEL